MKLFFFDLETTGVKYWKNGIWQIAGMVVIDGEIMETFDFKIQPNKACEIEDEALKVGGITRDDLKSFITIEEGYSSIIKVLSKYVDKFNKSDKFFLVGYNNASFDNQFFRAFFVQNGDSYFGSWFWSSSIDIMCQAADFLKKERHLMKDFKLSTVADFLKIEVDPDKLHDALYDIYLTKAIYDKISYK
ncbi:3'-5' exonuclease [Rhizosphaericola mali]|uniref:3'-5' exonuclease n=1 Tax=Rhizosphaericola mali TaxID=2545455 RepID=A0A5P2G3X2_9BACT|nr:3'-5' exonuclease [Rhizosphaericola mali]QES88829.1 3'-5' exonuclease [Rhizosphaericola mali]